MRKPIIVGNWKMNKTPSEALEFMKGIEEVLTGNEAADYGIGAPYVDLDVCVKNAKNLKTVMKRIPALIPVKYLSRC